MAKYVFSPCNAGTVLFKREDCEDGPRFLNVQVDGQDLYTFGLISNVAATLKGNYQFLHTVNSLIYLYAFGDRISTIAVSGMGLFSTGCKDTKTQLQSVSEFYKKNRVARRLDPLSIVLSGSGKTSFKFIGYLTGFNTEMRNNEDMGTVTYWTMTFEAVIDE